MFITALFILVKNRKLPRCSSMSDWFSQLWDILTMEYYLATKQEETIDSCDNLNESQRIILSLKKSQSQKYEISFI